MPPKHELGRARHVQLSRALARIPRFDSRYRRSIRGHTPRLSHVVMSRSPGEPMSRVWSALSSAARERLAEGVRRRACGFARAARARSCGALALADTGSPAPSCVAGRDDGTATSSSCAIACSCRRRRAATPCQVWSTSIRRSERLRSTNSPPALDVALSRRLLVDGRLQSFQQLSLVPRAARATSRASYVRGISGRVVGRLLRAWFRKTRGLCRKCRREVSNWLGKSACMRVRRENHCRLQSPTVRTRCTGLL